MAADGVQRTSPIKTVVVLVQENRSFDHMLGWFKELNREIDGVTGAETNRVSVSDSNSMVLQYGDKAKYVVDDPDHSIQAIYEQVFGAQWTEQALKQQPKPEMSGFAQNAERTKKGLSEVVMNGFKPDLIPVYKDLVDNFAICDRWFASVPASTQPNRLFVHSATSHGATSNDRNLLLKGFPQKTIFESVHEAGLSFGIYYQNPPATLFYKNLRKLKYLIHFHPYYHQFKKHCEEGKLPNYVVIEQRFFDLKGFPANDDHPSHDVAVGQKLIKEVYETLRASPQWNEILFIITYDEHGGFYDHFPTPVTGVPSPDGLVGPPPYYFKFDRLGVRVPTFFISPWIEPGVVVHEPSGPEPSSQFEHSSIAATVKKIFNLKEFLTKRDAWAGTFDGVLTRTTPRTDCPMKLAEPRMIREVEPIDDAKLSDFQEDLVHVAAVLSGDHMKKSFPHKLLEKMTVSDAVNYVEGAFNKFVEVSDKARKEGKSGEEIVTLGTKKRTLGNSSGFLRTMFSCMACNN